MALLVASYGLLREGLTAEQVIKLGVFSGKIQDYQQIQVEKITEKESFVTFYQRKTIPSHYALPFRQKK